MKSQRAVFRHCLAAALLFAGINVALANPVVFDRVIRPSVEFLEHGEVVGISQAAHQRLGIREGDLVEITSPLGTTLVVPTRVHGNRDDAVYARKTVRDKLNIEDGQVSLRLRAYTPAGPSGQAAAPGVVPFTRVRRPPESFLEYGDVVGLSATGLARLGLEEGQAVLMRAPNGNTLAARTKIHGTEADTLHLKKTMRDKLGIEDGAINMAVTPVSWPSSAPSTEPVTFNTIGRPPASFLELGDVVGMSYNDIVRLNARPGDEVTLTSSRGSLDAVIELLDRDEGTLFLKLTMRNQLGVRDGNATLQLQVTGRGSTVAANQEDAPVFWFRRLDTAQARAREEARPLMIFAYREGHGDSMTMLNVMEEVETRRALLPARKFRFDASQNDLLARQYSINRVPTILYLHPTGEEIGRFEGIVPAERIRAGVTYSQRIVREANPNIRDSDLE